MQWITFDRTVNGGCKNRLNYNDWKDQGEIWRLAAKEKKLHEWHNR